jgi:hypothetical protein
MSHAKTLVQQVAVNQEEILCNSRNKIIYESFLLFTLHTFCKIIDFFFRLYLIEHGRNI